MYVLYDESSWQTLKLTLVGHTLILCKLCKLCKLCHLCKLSNIRKYRSAPLQLSWRCSVGRYTSTKPVMAFDCYFKDYDFQWLLAQCLLNQPKDLLDWITATQLLQGTMLYGPSTLQITMCGNALMIDWLLITSYGL